MKSDLTSRWVATANIPEKVGAAEVCFLRRRHFNQTDRQTGSCCLDTWEGEEVKSSPASRDSSPAPAHPWLSRTVSRQSRTRFSVAYILCFAPRGFSRRLEVISTRCASSSMLLIALGLWTSKATLRLLKKHQRSQLPSTAACYIQGTPRDTNELLLARVLRIPALSTHIHSSLHERIMIYYYTSRRGWNASEVHSLSNSPT